MIVVSVIQSTIDHSIAALARVVDMIHCLTPTATNLATTLNTVTDTLKVSLETL